MECVRFAGALFLFYIDKQKNPMNEERKDHMNEKNYSAPKSDIIYFLETDLISVSGVSGKDPDLGEWDVEM